MAKEGSLAAVFEEMYFPHIFRAFYISVRPSNLFIAFTAILMLFVLGFLLDLQRPVVCRSDSAVRRIPRNLYWQMPTELDCYILAPEKLANYRQVYETAGPKKGIFATLLNFWSHKFNDMTILLAQLDFRGALRNLGYIAGSFRWAVIRFPFRSLIFFAAAFCVFTVCGGALSRSAAVQLARGEKPGPLLGIRFAFRKIISFFVSPLLPLGVILTFCGVVIALGLLANIPWFGEIILSILMWFILLVGLLFSIMIIGAAAGVNLMSPEIAYQGTDSFDSINRCFHYVFAKPWHMLFYTSVAAIYGSMCYLFVRFFAYVLLKTCYSLVKLSVFVSGKHTGQLDKISAIWPKPEYLNLLGVSPEFPRSATESVSAFIIYIAVLFICGLVAAYVVSFFYTANTIIYSLMRYKVDGTALNEIYIEAEQDEQEKPLKTRTAENELPQQPPDSTADSKGGELSDEGEVS